MKELDQSTQESQPEEERSVAQASEMASDDAKKLAYFVAEWGNGKPDSKNGESRERFEYKAGDAAIKEIAQYGDLCRVICTSLARTYRGGW